ncbi:Cardiolipin synthase B [Tepidimonas fonticaldi]|uniref:Cardiolipin synthase B n=1 Tax=Tepidimonas fonticaldi TaxID=1101373 RepID=A0A554XN90_9BURK|nr:cardiolipin synthase ClsB [Tepidimonas fonticaldi]TSE37295.1 Cardiolipin synthase B [Tepidimonas fonticaldi]
MTAPLRPGHRLRLLEGGRALFPAMVQAMDRARHLIHVETYIFVFAHDALPVAEAMERAARRGVQVRLVVDAVGTPQVPPEWVQRFRAAGVQWRIYAPLGRLGLLIPSRWRRLHRKLCVVDGVVGFCGGINLIDDRDDVVLGRLAVPRLDYAVEVSGPLVSDMLATMERLWWRLLAARRARQREFRAAWQAWRAARAGDDLHAWWHGWLTERDAASTDPESVPPIHGAAAAVLWRDNVRHRHDIEHAYLQAIAQARHELIIANAYFIPGRRLRHALAQAAARGVRVRLLVQGKYERFLQYHAPRPVHAWLLRAGVEIHEYAPSALHAKVAVADECWATVGSTNLDPISLLLAREANVVTTDARFVRHLRARLDHLMRTAGVALDMESLQRRPWRERARDWIAFAVMRAVLFLTGHRY